MSTKPLPVVHVPIPGMVTVRPVPDESKTDQDSLTVALLPMVTGLGDAENALIVGGGHGVTVTVV